MLVSTGTGFSKVIALLAEAEEFEVLVAVTVSMFEEGIEIGVE
jgi:hypothetical protein